MNGTGGWQGHIQRIYWGVSTTVIEGVIEQVRTTLTILTAEISAHLAEGALPGSDVATNAIHVAVTGDRANVTVTSAQDGSSVSAREPASDFSPQAWLRMAGVVLLGLIAIIAARFTVMQTQGWKF